MTAKEKLLLRAPDWSEEQAERALSAAEDARPTQRTSATDGHRGLLRRAAALRERQPEVVDAGALAREVRDELEQRTAS